LGRDQKNWGREEGEREGSATTGKLGKENTNPGTQYLSQSLISKSTVSLNLIGAERGCICITGGKRKCNRLDLFSKCAQNSSPDRDNLHHGIIVMTTVSKNNK
jgi:hypothetical protein